MSRKFVKIPENTFKQLVLGAGVICKAFDPNPNEGEANIEDQDLLGATTGGLNFSAVPSFSDMGEDIDNCPKNMAELKNLDTWDVKASGTFVSITAETVALMAAAADAAAQNGKVSPRNVLAIRDFGDIWIVADYGDGGMIAIRILNALSTGGFAIQTGDKTKGQFPFEFTGHYTLSNQNTPPWEVYISPGADEASTNGGTSE